MRVIEIWHEGDRIGFVGTDWRKVFGLGLAESVANARKFSGLADAYAWVDARPEAYRTALELGYELRVETAAYPMMELIGV